MVVFLLPHEKPVLWASVSVQEAIESNLRLEARFYISEGSQALRRIKRGKWPLRNLAGENGHVDLYRHTRFKLLHVEKSDYQYFQPSQANDLAPKSKIYLSPLLKSKLDPLRVKKGQILITCSGSIGNCAYVRNTLDGLIFSSDLIRIEAGPYNGYIYAFLKSKNGQALMQARKYGAVIQHINPEHLCQIPVPDPPDAIKQEIHDLIEESHKLRDDSNDLINAARNALQEELKLPTMEELAEQVDLFEPAANVLNYSVPLIETDDRLDASYHAPIVKVIERRITETARDVVKVGDSRISRSVIMPGRFKRVYVEEGTGVLFIGGKQIYELDPNSKKFLSLAHHKDRIRKELNLLKNMILITCSGTIGKTMQVPECWDGWTASQHIIRVVPTDDAIAGYLYAWLSCDHAYPLIDRHTHGAVVDEITAAQVSSISVPILRDEEAQRAINETVLDANQKRAEAYHLEQKALAVLDEKVIYADGQN